MKRRRHQPRIATKGTTSGGGGAVRSSDDAPCARASAPLVDRDVVVQSGDGDGSAVADSNDSPVSTAAAPPSSQSADDGARAAAAIPPLDPSGDGDLAPCAGKVCFNCRRQKTPQWRPGPAGPKTLCNTCWCRERAAEPEFKEKEKERLAARHIVRKAEPEFKENKKKQDAARAAAPEFKENKKKQDAARAAAPEFKEKKKKQEDARRAKELRETVAVAKAALASSSPAPSSLAPSSLADADSNKENIVPTPSVRVIRPSGAGSDTTAAIVRVDHANAATPPKSLAGFGDQLMARRGVGGTESFRRNVTLVEDESGSWIPLVTKPGGKTPSGVFAVQRECYGLDPPTEDGAEKLNVFIAGFCSKLADEGWLISSKTYILFGCSPASRLRVDVSWALTRTVTTFREARRVCDDAAGNRLDEIKLLNNEFIADTTNFLAAVEDVINTRDAGLSDDARASLIAGLEEAKAVVKAVVDEGVSVSAAAGAGIASGAGVASGASGAGVASGTNGLSSPASSLTPAGPIARKKLGVMLAEVRVLEKKAVILKTLAEGGEDKTLTNKRNSLQSAKDAVARARAADVLDDHTELGLSTGSTSATHEDDKSYACRLKVMLYAEVSCTCGIYVTHAIGKKFGVLKFAPQSAVGDMYVMTKALSRGDYKHRSASCGEHVSFMIDLEDKGDCSVALAEKFARAANKAYGECAHLLG